MPVDSIDHKAILALLTHGRMTWAELGAHLGLSAPAAAERARRLEELGLIRGFAAILDPELAGYPVLAFVFVTLAGARRRKAFLEGVRAIPLVLECHHVAGDDDYLLKVRCRDLKSLDVLLTDQLKGKLGAARTRTTIALGTAKETSRVPIDAPAPVGHVASTVLGRARRSRLRRRPVSS